MIARELLLEPLAYMPPARALDGLSAENAGRRLSADGHSIAEIVAHMTFWQGWFLRRCLSSPDPMPRTAADGWPAVAEGSWADIHKAFLNGLYQIAALGDRSDRLDNAIAPAIEFPPLAEYTVRDALTHVANHNAHHLGQIITIRQLTGAWPPPSGSYTW
ncbi:MAG TPA: DinB family protein [Vicinamibacterales bacterium]|nr:DinB family protein [Vicinamibacterales bacterium]